MPQFPSYATLLMAGYSESFDPAVERTDMERGVPKLRLINSQVLMKVAATLLFRRPADAAAFEVWYFNELQRIGWFTFRDPRRGIDVTARFEGGSIGALSAQAPGFYLAKRDVVLEYLR